MKREQEIDKYLTTTHEITELDRMIKFMTAPKGTVTLSAAEMELYKRIEVAYDHLDEFTDVEVRNLIMNKFNVSRSTAYNDIDKAYMVHGKIAKLRKDLSLYFLEQKAKLMLRNAFETRDVNKQTKAVEVYTRVIALMKDEEMIDWRKIQPSNFYLIINNTSGESKSSLKVDMNMIQKLNPDQLAEIKQQMIENSERETVDILEEYINGEPGTSD